MNYYLFNRSLDDFSDDELIQFYQVLKKKLAVMKNEIVRRDNAPRFSAKNDPYWQVGSRSYWKLHVPASQRPDCVKETYGLD